MGSCMFCVYLDQLNLLCVRWVRMSTCVMVKMCVSGVLCGDVC